MDYRFLKLIRVVFGLELLIFLLPGTMLFSTYLFGWVFFLFLGFLTISKRFLDNGWGNIKHIFEWPPSEIVTSISLLSLAAGFSLASLWGLIIEAYNGKSIKDVHLGLWLGLIFGSTCLFLFIEPSAWFENNPKFKGNIWGNIILGLGPLIISGQIVLWYISKFLYDRKYS